MHHKELLAGRLAGAASHVGKAGGTVCAQRVADAIKDVGGLEAVDGRACVGGVGAATVERLGCRGVPWLFCARCWLHKGQFKGAQEAGNAPAESWNTKLAPPAAEQAGSPLTMMVSVLGD